MPSAAMGLGFDSKAGLQVIEEIQKIKCTAEFDSSIDMSIERGSFEGFSAEIENTSEFVQMMEKEMHETYERMMKFGRRNISVSTVAPTGTLSILAQTSSGIEPVYLLSYKRRRKVNPNDKNQRVDFVDPSGDSWQEFEV
jgi:ribonucleoside-diphosphate reductase alpha chain